MTLHTSDTQYQWHSILVTLNTSVTRAITFSRKTNAPSANPGNPLCTHLKKGDSHLKHKSLISPSHGSPSSLRHSAVSPSHTYHRPPQAAVALRSLFLHSDTPPPVHPPSDWLRLFLSQTFPCINIPTVSSWKFFLLTPPLKTEQSVPKRLHIKFRYRGIAQKKEYNRTFIYKESSRLLYYLYWLLLMVYAFYVADLSRNPTEV